MPRLPAMLHQVASLPIVRAIEPPAGYCAIPGESPVPEQAQLEPICSNQREVSTRNSRVPDVFFQLADVEHWVDVGAVR